MAAKVGVLLALLAVAGARMAEAGPLASMVAAQVPEAGPAVVLLAGDGSLPVFDNAVDGVDARLAALSNGRASVTRLSASVKFPTRHHGHPATLDRVVSAISGMRPPSGQGCLVFATSHGVRHQGLYLSMGDEVLTPKQLDRALLKGCGSAPTVVVVSACFSGSFVKPPMRRANRIILTAARADRTSFGCGAGRVYTVFDQCLLGAMDRESTWKMVYVSARRCVSAEERREDVAPSEPQAWFGAKVAGTILPMRAQAR
jgi:hypothetical protein